MAAALLGCTEALAQAFDGDCDEKIFAGYVYGGGNSGVECGYALGANDYLSATCTARCLFLDESEYADPPGPLAGLDAVFKLNLHFSQWLSLPQWFDFYAGPAVGFHTGGFDAGLRLNFSERFGIYAECLHPLFNTLGDTLDDGPSVYEGRTFLSAGLTFNLE